MSFNNENLFEKIPADKFKFVQKGESLHDKKLQTKPLGYVQDALMRFSRNRGSLICFVIIVLLVLYAIFVPVFTQYGVEYKDSFYSYAVPRIGFLAKTGFWDGCQTREVNQQSYDYYSRIPGAMAKDYGEVEHTIAGRIQIWHKIKINTYDKVGFVKRLLTKQEYVDAITYEKTSGKQLFYPLLNEKLINNPSYNADQNAWFLTDNRGRAKLDSNGNVQDIYAKSEDLPDTYVYFLSKMNDTQYETRVLYKEWYFYKHGYYASYIFGADSNGYDICSRLASGARLSLVLSIVVAIINLFIGIIIGALEGYYGGTFDLLMERFKEVLYEIPFVVCMSLFQLYFAHKVGAVVTMLFAFCFFGWIGTSSTVRAQFYRFKGQDYVMAARTLGAKDSRLIFRHVLPNSIGFIITTSVLTIPGVILSESILTYLGIVNLQSSTITSVGTMLKNGQPILSTYPHCLFFPALFISILLVCFNEFGNGLRDAFNPSLRGADE
jgi:oligopeptide transport system permease protein